MDFLEALKQVKRKPNQIGLRPVTPPGADNADETAPFDWRTGCCYSLSPKRTICLLCRGTLRGRMNAHHSGLLSQLVFTSTDLLGEWELVTEKELNAEYYAANPWMRKSRKRK